MNSVLRRRGSCDAHSLLKPGFDVLHFEVAVDDLEILFGFVVQVFLELVALMAVMEELDGLFETDGDDEAEDNGGDVDEEVAQVVAAWWAGWMSSMEGSSRPVRKGY